MKLLILTQAVDTNDPALGFFGRWVEEFAKTCDSVEVLALSVGTHALPRNVRVRSLGKEKGRSRMKYVFNFYRYAWSLRREYDAVFVHMNPEYLVAAGWYWRLTGKKTGLWYMHKSVDLKLRVAAFFADVIFTASKESFRLPSNKVRVMGHGIDTDFFCPDAAVARGTHWLSVGRLNTSKRHDLAIRAAVQEGKALRIAGKGPERGALEALAREFGADVQFLGGLTQTQLREEYRRAALFIHTSETGSLDKVVLEALSCGCPVRTNDSALKSIEREGPAYVRERHSLKSLIPAILKELTWNHR